MAVLGPITVYQSLLLDPADVLLIIIDKSGALSRLFARGDKLLGVDIGVNLVLWYCCTARKVIVPHRRWSRPSRFNHSPWPCPLRRAFWRQLAPLSQISLLPQRHLIQRELLLLSVHLPNNTILLHGIELTIRLKVILILVVSLPRFRNALLRELGIGANLRLLQHSSRMPVVCLGRVFNLLLLL